MRGRRGWRERLGRDEGTDETGTRVEPFNFLWTNVDKHGQTRPLASLYHLKAAEAQPRCNRGAAEAQHKCCRDAAEVRGGAAEVEQRCSRGANNCTT